jgi:porin
VRQYLCSFRGKKRPCLSSALFAVASLLPAPGRAHENLVDLSATNFTDVLSNVHGGLKTGTRVLDKADVTATFLGDDHDLPGISVFLDVQATDAVNFSGGLVGDAQNVSNLDGPAGLRLANAWIAKDYDGRAGLKAGIVDLNTEFDVQSTASLFLNASFGIGPDFSQSGENGPSIFPATGLGLAGWWLPYGHWQLKAGVFEGTPGNPGHPGRTDLAFTREEGALLVMEVRNHLTPDFVVGAGGWRYTRSFDAIDPAQGRLSGNSGYYAIADGLLYAAPQGEGAGLKGWMRIGFADDRINLIDATVNGGLVYTAPFGRDADQTGLSFAHARFGESARQAMALSAGETAFEATYSFGLNSHLSIQPDFQYVMSPAGDPMIEDAIVMGSRITASW